MTDLSPSRPGSRSRSRSPVKSRPYNPPSPSHAPYSYSQYEDERGPRSFPHEVKLACWEKAQTIPGRDPDRWRMDCLGNTVFRKLVACDGCLCYDYDHIQPYSKGGKSTLDNCQVLQTAANRAKGNREEMTNVELMQRSA
eukprot:jgi/Mesen1/3203/ME000185S02339